MGQEKTHVHYTVIKDVILKLFFICFFCNFKLESATDPVAKLDN